MTRFLNKIQAFVPKLTPAQIDEVKKELVKDGHPVRFLYNGQALNIETGEVCSKGCNIFYQIVYWNFTKETAKKIAGWLGVKAVFDEE
jgi:hypothetical protein